MDGVTVFDPDRLVASLEHARMPWARVHEILVYYALQSDCFYRRQPVDKS